MQKSKIMLLVVLVTAGLLGGCASPTSPVDSPTTPTAVTPTIPPSPTVPPSPVPSATPDSSAPDALITQETDAGPLYLIRYEGGEGLCVALTFDPQTLAANHCGLRAGAGVGFVETLTAPDGRAARVAFGLAPSDAVTAVAVEFTSGANAPAAASGGGYLLVLEDGQTPRRATAIDQYGYMAGQWGF